MRLLVCTPVVKSFMFFLDDNATMASAEGDLMRSAVDSFHGEKKENEGGEINSGRKEILITCLLEEVAN